MSVRLVNPESLARPVGYSHAAVGHGATVELAGQVGWDVDEKLADGLVAQFALALDNLLEALAGCGGKPEDMARLRIFTTDVAGYRAHLREIGAAYRERFSRHFPTMSLLGIDTLFDPGALIEIEGVAYVD